MQRRYADDAVVEYFDVAESEVKSTHAALLAEIDSRGLLFPVTVLDGVPIYDGAVSYPAILRAVGNKLVERQAAAAE